MSAAFMWTMGLDNRFVYIVLHKTIVAEIRFSDGEFDQASVSEHLNSLAAKDFALRLTVFWGDVQGFTLGSIYYHPDAEGSMIAGSLRTARDLVQVNEDVEHLCEVVVTRLHTNGKVLH